MEYVPGDQRFMFFMVPEIKDNEDNILTPEQVLTDHVLAQEESVLGEPMGYDLIPIDDDEFYNKALENLPPQYASAVLVDRETLKMEMVDPESKGILPRTKELYFRAVMFK